MRKTFKYFLFALILITAVSTSAFAWNASDEVMRLNREAPSMDTFGNPLAVVWLKNQEMKLNKDGVLDITRYLIIYFGERIPNSLREYKVAAPAEGELNISAGIYNPMNGIQERRLQSEISEIPGGTKIHTVAVPDEACGRALVIVEKEKRIGTDGINETIPMAAQYPIWEQKISAEVPSDKSLFWLANEMREPEIINEGGRKAYFWDVTNQPAWHGAGMVVFQRPYISFTSEEKLEPVLKAMQKKAESYARIEAPVYGDAKKLMKWLENPEKNEANLPRNMIRHISMLPKDGPWTQAERTLLLNGWLNKNNKGTQIWWQSPTVITEDSSVAEDFWTAPVIVETEGKKKATYYHCGQGVEYGEVSPFLAGTDVYSLKPGGGIQSKEVKAGDPSNHKFYLLWNLKLGNDGVAEGTLSAIVDGAWAGIFSNGAVPSAEQAVQLITKKADFAIAGMTLTAEKVTPRTSGYRIDFKVRCALGIIQNKNMLVRLPGGVPEILGELVNDEENIQFRFPFVIEQKVVMSTPKGYKCFQPVVNKAVGTKKTSHLVEKIAHNDPRNKLEAEYVWVVKKLKLEMEDGRTLKQQLGEVLRWPVLNLPFRK